MSGVLFLFFTIIFLAIVFSIINKKSKIDEEQMNIVAEDENGNAEIIDGTNFEEKFYERVKQGEQYQLFIKISSKQDCVMIRSMLVSAEIPTYTESEHMNGVYGGFSGTVNTVFAIRLFILVDDYEEAYQIVREYIENKKNTLKLENQKNENVGTKVLKDVVSILVAPYPIFKEQEILGMTIYPRKNSETNTEQS